MGAILDSQSLQRIKLFAAVTRVYPIDVFFNNGVQFFVVPYGEGSRAIGRGGKNAQFLRKKFGTPITILESLPKIEFFRALIAPLNPEKVYEDPAQSEILLVEASDRKTKALLIGRNASNLRALEEIMRRRFSIQEIKIV